MTAEELRAAYLGAADIVEVNEFGWKGMPCIIWQPIRESGKSPAETVKLLKECATTAVANYPGPPFLGKLDQFDHPDFLRYVSAKLGAMTLLLAALLASGCTVTGKVHCEHRRGPDSARASVEFSK